MAPATDSPPASGYWLVVFARTTERTHTAPPRASRGPGARAGIRCALDAPPSDAACSRGVTGRVGCWAIRACRLAHGADRPAEGPEEARPHRPGRRRTAGDHDIPGRFDGGPRAAAVVAPARHRRRAPRRTRRSQTRARRRRRR